MDVMVERCAGLDVHKKSVMATIRMPDGRGGRAQTTREFATFTGRLVELRDWLVAAGVTHVETGLVPSVRLVRPWLPAPARTKVLA